MLTPRWDQDGLKTGPRRVQERQKSDTFFVLIFDSFWGRLGVVLGPILGAKIDQNPKEIWEKSGAFFVLIFDSFGGRLGVVLGIVLGAKSTQKAKGVWQFSILFSILFFDGFKMAPRPFQEGSWGALGSSWGGSWAALGGSWALFGGSWGAFEPS